MGKFGRLRAEGGASAVEFALLAPLLFMLVFAIIGFGVAFMQMQTIRGALREGGRAAATGSSANEVRDHVVSSSTGSVSCPGGGSACVDVHPNTGNNPVCTHQNIGADATVSYDASNLPDGGITVSVPFLPVFHLTPTLEANFRCEV
jgi:Flp pilus assembly protein TadG